MKKNFFILVLFFSGNFYSSLSFSFELEKDARIIKYYSEIFEDKDDTLTITFDNKKSKSFVTKYSPHNIDYVVESYKLLEYAVAQNHVVIKKSVDEEKAQPELVSYWLISLKQGKETELIGEPVWNNTQNKFVSIASGSYQAGYCDHQKCTLLPKVEGKYMSASWSNEDELILSKEVNTSCVFKNKKMTCKK